MERAKWNGREYTASEIAADFETERTIRRVSGRELFCPDPECKTPLLRYCHGEKKHAYFAHLQTGACDYAQFDKQPGIIREVRYKLYELFKRKGYDVYTGCQTGKEIDFVAQMNDRRIYLQSTFSLTDEQTARREYAAMETIRDNYEKAVVSLDDFTLPSNNGILHFRAWELYNLL